MLGIIAVASLAALGLSAYNAATFDDRVKTYVDSHPKAFRTMVERYTPEPKAIDVDCLATEIESWASDLTAQVERDGSVFIDSGFSGPNFALC